MGVLNMSLRFILLGACAMPALATFAVKDVSKLSTANSLYFFALGDEKCGNGAQMFYGIITPHNMSAIDTEKTWIESMGGAVCFNAESCADREYSVWLGLKTIISRYVRTVPDEFGGSVDAMFGALTSGFPIDMDLFRQLDVGYFPNGAGGGLENQLGYYFPGCQGDAGLGNYEVSYNSTMTLYQTGGSAYEKLLQAMRQRHTNLKRVTMIGASGSAVSRVAWAPTLADMFPAAEIRVLADSAFHVLPATAVYDYFFTQIKWSPNPDADHVGATIYRAGITLPSFDWRQSTAIYDMLNSYGGRVKLCYLACKDDKVVLGDRLGLAAYANINVSMDFATEMWVFLKDMTQNALPGTVYSYIQEGDCHHQTRDGFEPAISPSDSNDPGANGFISAFLKGEPSSPNNNTWCCSQIAPEYAPASTTTTPNDADVDGAESVTPALCLSAILLAVLRVASQQDRF